MAAPGEGRRGGVLLLLNCLPWEDRLTTPMQRNKGKLDIQDHETTMEEMEDKKKTHFRRT